ncbi:MAG: response regulator [Candidatus Lokiarchaeota archaeon]|nr:response regulator [Candidatus Lokiarchaeota archaeon]
MDRIVFLVEDDRTLVQNLKIFLEMNDFKLISALNGKEGLDKLSNLEQLPDLIISDILMPEMDGYDLYMKVSENPEWSRIPFIFLSGKAEPDDVRFGKLLGADDYITKPFRSTELLLRIEETIQKYIEIRKTSIVIEHELKEILKFEEPSLKKHRRADFFYIFYLVWNSKTGPEIKDFFPKNEIPSLNLKELTSQLYSTLIKIYKFEELSATNQFTIRVVRDLVDAYALVEKLDENIYSNGVDTFMLCAITPNSHYLQSKAIKEVLGKIASTIKGNKELNIKKFWEQLLEIE